MQQDARIPDRLTPIGSGSPLVFDEQVIISVSLLSSDVTDNFSRDLQNAILNCKHLARILILGALEPGVKTSQILSIKKLNDFVSGTARRLPSSVRFFRRAAENSGTKAKSAGSDCRSLEEMTAWSALGT